MTRIFIRLHRFNLLIILFAAFFSILGLLKFSTIPQVQFLIVLSLIFFYLAWALMYHLLDKSLTLEVTLEYVLTALLAVVVLYGVLL